MRIRFCPILALFLPSLSLVGCDREGEFVRPDLVAKGSPQSLLISNRDRIGPDEAPSSAAILNLAGDPMEVELETEHDGDQYSILVMVHGEEFDKESYASLPDAFQLVEVAGERFDPPVDILRFPMRVGDVWAWKGQTFTGKSGIDSEAKVTTASETVYVNQVPVDSIRSTVSVTLKGGAASADRDLVFWFAPGKGLFKRQFGATSIREPKQE